MGKIWLKSVDPSHVCCGCEGKAGPCDPCENCKNIAPIIFDTLAEAEAYFAYVSINCLAACVSPENSTGASINNVGNQVTFSASKSLNTNVDFAVELGFNQMMIKISALTDVTFSFNCSVIGLPLRFNTVTVDMTGTCLTIGGHTSSQNSTGLSNNGLFTFSNVTPGYYIVTFVYDYSIFGVSAFPYTISTTCVITDTLNPTLVAYPMYVTYGSTLLKCS